MVSLGKRSDLFSPAKTFLIVWTVAIGLAEFKFSGFQHKWSFYSWFVLLTGLISFLAGTFISYSLFSDKPIKKIKSIRENILNSSKSKYKILFHTSIILFLIYLTAYILEVMIIGNVPIFSRRLDEARSEFGVFGLHLIVNFQLIIMFLNIEYLLLYNGKRIEKLIIWIIFIVTLLTFGLLLQRFNYFIWGAMTITFVYYASKFFSFKKIILVTLIFFVFLAVVQSIRLSQYVQAFIYMTSKMKYSKDYALFTEPYLYITMNLENMARAVKLLENNSFGILTADWIFAFSGIKRWVAEYFNVNARPFLVSGYNTFPFLWNYYSDFGIFGVFLFPMLTGFFISVIYYIMRITGSVKWIIYYSLSMVLIIISFFTNPLTMLNFIVCIFILWFIHRFVVKERKIVTKNNS
jgi:oligosaccharide repeat unit polymerase